MLNRSRQFCTVARRASGAFTFFAVSCALMVAGCSDGLVAPDAAQVEAHSTADGAAAAAKANGSLADAFVWFGTNNPVDGASARLVRTPNGITLNLHTADLEPGHVYSVWLVAFENPAACASTDGCVPGDLSNPDVDATIFGSVAGSVIGGTGTATLAGHVKPGDPTLDILRGDGSLDNPMSAEIHFVIRTHGIKIPGMVHDQAATFNAGCFAGEPNEGMCANRQTAIFTG